MSSSESCTTCVTRGQFGELDEEMDGELCLNKVRVVVRFWSKIVCLDVVVCLSLKYKIVYLDVVVCLSLEYFTLEFLESMIVSCNWIPMYFYTNISISD